MRESSFTPLLLPLLMAATALLLACPKEKPAPEAGPYPKRLVSALMDAPRERVSDIIHDVDTGAKKVPGPLDRFNLTESMAEEVIVFTNVRSARVNSVILKLPARSTDADKTKFLKELPVPLRTDAENEAADNRLRYRFRPADKEGRPTLTVETSPQP